jgi:hypothetical protein
MNPHRVEEAKDLLARWRANESLSAEFPLYTMYLESLSRAERLNAVHQYMRPLITQLLEVSQERRFALIDAQGRNLNWRERNAGSSPVPGMPHEYLVSVATPTILSQWRSQPNDPRAHLWLALLPSHGPQWEIPSTNEFLQAAFDLAPQDLFIRERYIERHLESIWFACHHLPKSLLATVEKVRIDIELVRQLSSAMPVEVRSRYEERLQWHQEALDSYEKNANVRDAI